ncbi:L-type lectin-domain containing receptor kinase IX.1-like [Lotus japonicus]|uniref:L-type lectin-domain containing receptor kinase IX.1-like n=1 Tax=Lotus japonicus TaxID=34305 RepID=UPI002584D902|nr:L-type lectin-domain containing receptor kinase IX.1-like [Lotus japonicus]
MAAPPCHQKTHLLFSFHITLTLLLVEISSAAPLSFNYQQLSNTGNSFNFLGDVYKDKQALQLTRYEKDSLGRVIYSKQLHLWDTNSSKITDFTTSFSFTMNTPNKTHHGDGITFYLAQPNFPLPVPRDGSGMGLASRDQLANPNYTKEHPFVAVEFDTFANDWDPKYHHVGIDVNSISTDYSTQWFTSMDERGYEAVVSFNSDSNNLSVTFTDYKDNITIKQNLSCVVNLREALPDWVEFGFTSATGFFFEEHTLESWSFNSSLDFEARKDGSKTGLVVGLSVGGAGVLICVLVLACFVTWKLRKRGVEGDSRFDLAMDSDFERSSFPRKFSYEELARATSNFAKEHKIGEGGFGGVYKGFIRNLNTNVAIKKVSPGSKQGVKEYASEVKIISQLRHKNLVQLFGWCHQKNELLLVYEFMENGSLDYYLFKGKGLLTWAVRYNIARGLASALLYLHEEWEQCVLHRDIKSSNVMLDSNFNVKLGDFGLARLMDHGTESKTTGLAGTYGYLSPEAATRGKASRESDVYSFGVVALEIACGRKAIEPNLSEEHIYLVDWVLKLYGKGDLLKAADSKLYGDFDEKEVERLMIVGLWCTHEDYLQRPVIRQVAHVLTSEVPLPILPSSQVSALTQSSSLRHVASKSPAFENNQSGTSTSSNSSITRSSQSSTAFEVISPSAALLRTY